MVDIFDELLILYFQQLDLELLDSHDFKILKYKSFWFKTNLEFDLQKLIKFLKNNCKTEYSVYVEWKFIRIDIIK